MGKESKEERILELFLNEPTKHWHFKDIIESAKISEPNASKWLKKFLKEGIINRVKPHDKMPYFISNHKQNSYRNKKKIFALEKLNRTGLLSKLGNLKNAKVITIFGSFSRSDWNSSSDVDVFIVGDAEDLEFGIPWSGLGFQGKARDIQVHNFQTIEDIKKIKSGLIKNVMKGYFVKGDIFDIGEVRV